MILLCISGNVAPSAAVDSTSKSGGGWGLKEVGRKESGEVRFTCVCFAGGEKPVRQNKSRNNAGRNVSPAKILSSRKISVAFSQIFVHYIN